MRVTRPGSFTSILDVQVLQPRGEIVLQLLWSDFWHIFASRGMVEDTGKFSDRLLVELNDRFLSAPMHRLRWTQPQYPGEFICNPKGFQSWLSRGLAPLEGDKSEI